MIYRRVWTMELRHGFESEYDKAHAAIWPELADQMVADGIVSFQLYRVGVTIFATQERDSEFADAKPPPSELTEKWWTLMTRFMITDEHGRPVRTELKEVFSLENTLLRREAKRCAD